MLKVICRINRNTLQYMLVVSGLFMLAGCSLFSNKYAVNTYDGKLETLQSSIKQSGKAANIEGPDEPAPAIDVREIASTYKSAYHLLSDPVQKLSILQRLAALDLKHAENLDVAGDLTASAEAYQVAIDAYTLLLANEQQGNRDELLYGLSKAYGLAGKADLAFDSLTRLVSDYDDSPYWQEAQFRRGEYLFSNQRYRDAANTFVRLLERQPAATIEPGSQSTNESVAFFANARYMAAWAYFKNSRYDASIKQFVAMLDSVVTPDVANDPQASLFPKDYTLGTKAFPNDDKLVADALRGLSLSLAYAPIEDAVSRLQQALRVQAQRVAQDDGLEDVKPLAQQESGYQKEIERRFAPWVYAELAELYYAQERHSDAATIYAAYQSHYPNSVYAPWFGLQNIAMLQHAGFNTDAWLAKGDWANHYHPNGSYYKQYADDPRVNHYLNDKLVSYLNDLSSYHHAKARKLMDEQKALVPASVTRDDVLTPETIAAYDKASYWYRQKLAAFPDADDVGETYYLLAESLNESLRYPEAIKAYEVAAYGGYEFVDASNAAYAALVVYNKLMDSIPEQASDKLENESTATNWRAAKVESALLFAEHYRDDKRRQSVLANTVDDLNKLQQWERVVTVADKLLVTTTSVDNSIAATTPAFSINDWSALQARHALPTLLSSAAALYKLDRLREAENRYSVALTAMNNPSQFDSEDQAYVAEFVQHERIATVENYASSIYRQAEQSNAQGNKEAAISQFNRLVALAPISSIRASAQRDAIELLVEIKAWDRVSQAIPVFLSDYPEHKDRAALRQNLLVSYAELEQWTDASALSAALADELKAGGERFEDGPGLADLRIASADYANKAGDTSLSIQRYQQLIQDYGKVDETLFEARHQLALLYQKNKDKKSERYQYQRLVALHEQAKQPTDRMNYIAANAQSIFAEERFTTFMTLKITTPLQKSLKRKKQALESAVEAYDRTERYAVEKYALQATERKGQIYAAFAAAIMASERPQGLDELALEEYDILLEEQAYPFEEQAIEIHEVNVKRAWQGMKSPAIKSSYKALAELLPARYNKPEKLN